MTPPLHDVAIVGAGPAGSTAAILLARRGLRVLLLEKERFPRFHIGESLLPASTPAFDRLGIRDLLERSAIVKHGGEIATGCGTRSVKFYFKNALHNPEPTAYQVVRSEFDRLLLERARAAGADVREETTVAHAVAEPDRVLLATRSEEGAAVECAARFLLDCSGRNALFAAGNGLKRPYPDLKKVAIYAHFNNVQREEGIDAGHIRLVRAKGHWFWMIPLTDSLTSVGAVFDAADLRERKLPPEEILRQACDAQPLVRQRMAGATRASPVHTSGDYSYRATRLAGHRWALAGDAAGFIDPIFSTGVFLAILSAERAADAAAAFLENPARGRRLLASYERRMRSIFRLYLRFVRAWYREEFIEVFTAPNPPFDLPRAVNSVLAGNVSHRFSIWWRMQLFYAVVALQRHLPVCPRLAQPLTA